jgi:hypothetical protein
LKKRSILSANPPALFSDVEEVEDDGEEDYDVLALRLASSHGTSTQASHRRRLTTTFSTGRCASFDDSRRSGGIGHDSVFSLLQLVAPNMTSATIVY